MQDRRDAQKSQCKLAGSRWGYEGRAAALSTRFHEKILFLCGFSCRGIFCRLSCFKCLYKCLPMQLLTRQPTARRHAPPTPLAAALGERCPSPPPPTGSGRQPHMKCLYKCLSVQLLARQPHNDTPRPLAVALRIHRHLAGMPLLSCCSGLEQRRPRKRAHARRRLLRAAAVAATLRAGRVGAEAWARVRIQNVGGGGS